MPTCLHPSRMGGWDSNLRKVRLFTFLLGSVRTVDQETPPGNAAFCQHLFLLSLPASFPSGGCDTFTRELCVLCRHFREGGARGKSSILIPGFWGGSGAGVWAQEPAVRGERWRMTLGLHSWTRRSPPWGCLAVAAGVEREKMGGVVPYQPQWWGKLSVTSMCTHRPPCAQAAHRKLGCSSMCGPPWPARRQPPSVRKPCLTCWCCENRKLR